MVKVRILLIIFLKKCCILLYYDKHVHCRFIAIYYIVRVNVILSTRQ